MNSIHLGTVNNFEMLRDPLHSHVRPSLGLLASGGSHAPIILDDVLVYTDDDRIERMFDALHRQAGDLQIIVLSCRQRAFRELGGQKLAFKTVSVGGDGA